MDYKNCHEQNGVLRQQLLAANLQAKDFFDKLSFSNHKEYVRWITSAKREETRAKRLQDSVQMLVNGVKHP